MSAYNRGAYVRAQAAALARRAYEGPDVNLRGSQGVWRYIALAQALAMQRPDFAYAYLKTARAAYKAEKEIAARWVTVGV